MCGGGDQSANKDNKARNCAQCFCVLDPGMNNLLHVVAAGCTLYKWGLSFQVQIKIKKDPRRQKFRAGWKTVPFIKLYRLCRNLSLGFSADQKRYFLLYLLLILDHASEGPSFTLLCDEGSNLLIKSVASACLKVICLIGISPDHTLI